MLKYISSLVKLSLIMTISISAWFLFSFVSANQVFSAPDASRDAIAVRVMPNPDHLSPLRWYQKNNFKGSPQNLTVDGYEAIRDGRTVYVNAANIVDNNFWTNIYIISYNQQAQSQTVDIFGQMLAHWKFNTNITTVGACSLTASQSCVYSSECPKDEYCLSNKAKIIRDTKRLADLAEIKSVLDNYQKNHNGDYKNLLL